MADFATVVPALVRKGDDYSLRQCAVLLRVIAEPERQTVRGMADALRVSKPAITRAIDRLQSEGLVRRIPDNMDRRSVFVLATDKGRDWVTALSGPVGAAA